MKLGLVAAIAVAGALGLSSSAFALLPAGANAGTVTINANGSVSITAPAGTYDGVEDVAYNVINNAPVTVQFITVTGTGIAGFDQDGINNYVNAAGAQIGAFGTVLITPDPSDQAYAGYNAGAANSVSNYTFGGNTVRVNFGGGGLASGGTSWFSLEAPAGAGTGINVTPSIPLPAAAWMGMGLLGGLGLIRKLRSRKS